MTANVPVNRRELVVSTPGVVSGDWRINDTRVRMVQFCEWARNHRWPYIREQWPVLAHLTDAHMDLLATWPRPAFAVRKFSGCEITVHDGDIDIQGEIITPEEVPLIVQALQDAAQAIKQWQRDVEQWFSEGDADE